jgi:hypothetical protein
MAKFYDALNAKLKAFIEAQQMFFVATAPNDGRINLSPKGMDTFRILDDRSVGYLDLTGSGAETAAHLRENGRLTIMFCSFTEASKILRLYGRGQVIRPGGPQWDRFHGRFGAMPGERQIIMLDVGSLQTSCGFGVPMYEYKGQRPLLAQWTQKKGRTGIERYWRERNHVSIDGLPTGLGEAGHTSGNRQR